MNTKVLLLVFCVMAVAICDIDFITRLFGGSDGCGDESAFLASAQLTQTKCTPFYACRFPNGTIPKNETNELPSDEIRAILGRCGSMRTCVKNKYKDINNHDKNKTASFADFSFRDHSSNHTTNDTPLNIDDVIDCIFPVDQCDHGKQMYHYTVRPSTGKHKGDFGVAALTIYDNADCINGFYGVLFAKQLCFPIPSSDTIDCLDSPSNTLHNIFNVLF